MLGLIISIIAYNKSKAVGYKNNLALAGIIIAAVLMVLSIVLNASGAFSGMYGNV